MTSTPTRPISAYSPVGFVRRSILVWVVQAKRPQTRAARVREAAEQAVRGVPAHQQ
jgi:uncharacterized protein YdeI (YjbR/CyaY-like superfamily)